MLLASALPDPYYDYDFGAQDYKRPNLDLRNVPSRLRPVANSSLDALLNACPGLKASISRGETLYVYYFPNKLGGKSDVKDVSFLFDGELSKEVFSKFPRGFHDPQWGEHLVYRIDLINKGVWMDWPTDIWLCHEPLFDKNGADHDFIMGYQRTWHQANVFKPIPALPDLPPSPPKRNYSAKPL